MSGPTGPTGLASPIAADLSSLLADVIQKKPTTSADALKLVADLELIIQTYVMRDLPDIEKKAFALAKWAVPLVRRGCW